MYLLAVINLKLLAADVMVKTCIMRISFGSYSVGPTIVRKPYFAGLDIVYSFTTEILKQRRVGEKRREEEEERRGEEGERKNWEHRWTDSNCWNITCIVFGMHFQ